MSKLGNYWLPILTCDGLLMPQAYKEHHIIGTSAVFVWWRHYVMMETFVTLSSSCCYSLLSATVSTMSLLSTHYLSAEAATTLNLGITPVHWPRGVPLSLLRLSTHTDAIVQFLKPRQRGCNTFSYRFYIYFVFVFADLATAYDFWKLCFVFISPFHILLGECM